MSRQIFLTLIRSAKEKAYAQVLIDSIRAFGGEMNECPIWVFESNTRQEVRYDFAGNSVQVIPLNVPSAVRDYLFADKVYVCAQAEAMASSNVQSLIWIDPSCLIVNPPTLFALGAAFDAAVRPVHIRNVGQLADEPLDDFWRAIYANAGVNDVAMTVESFVDTQRLRAYFNTHAFAINPAKGLCARWRDAFASLVSDVTFQTRVCADERYQIFLPQAVLSALLATALDPQRIRILPPAYNYPYNLHAQVPIERRAQSLNDLVCFTYEDRSIDSGAVIDIEIDERLCAWLAVHQPR